MLHCYTFDVRLVHILALAPSVGLLVEAKMFTFALQNARILFSTSVPFRPTTVEMPNLEPVETKRITVCLRNYCVVYSYRASDHSKFTGMEILNTSESPPPPPPKKENFRKAKDTKKRGC